MLAHTRVKGRSGADGRLKLSSSIVCHSTAAEDRLIGWAWLLRKIKSNYANLEDKDENVGCWLPGRRGLIGPLPTQTRVSVARSGVPGDDTWGTGWPLVCTPNTKCIQGVVQLRACLHEPGRAPTSSTAGRPNTPRTLTLTGCSILASDPRRKWGISISLRGRSWLCWCCRPAPTLDSNPSRRNAAAHPSHFGASF